MTSRAAALAAGVGQYVGKLCPKHPERGGARYVRGRHCVACASLSGRRRYANQTPEQREWNRARKRVANMMPEQRERNRARQRVANQTPERVARNRERDRGYMRRWNAAHRERTRDVKRRRAYGVTQQQFEVVFAAQNHCCGICGADEPGGRGHWHLDHSHDDGKPRGVLCNGCNGGLGFFRDNAEALRRAIRYLDEAAAYSERGRFRVLLDMFS